RRGAAVVLAVLEQRLAWQLLAAPHQRAEPARVQLDLAFQPALGAEAEAQAAAHRGDVAVEQRGHAVGTVDAGVLAVADPDQGEAEQAYHHGHHAFATEARTAEVAAHRVAQRWQRAAELRQPVELLRAALLGPGGVVAVLLAATRVAAGGLQVAARVGADPDLGPGRRDRQLAEPRQHVAIAHPAAIRSEVGEATTMAAAANAGFGIAAEGEPQRRRRDALRQLPGEDDDATGKACGHGRASVGRSH